MIQSIINYFSKGKIHIQDDQQFILLTYRSKIIKCQQSTYYSSDAGWGCMLRVGQMFIANLLLKKQKFQKQAIIKLFQDNMNVPFSIQMITKLSKELFPHKQNFQWYTPCQIGFIIKNMLQIFDNKYSVSICNDNTLFLSDISLKNDKIVVLIMARIGLDEPQKQYLQCVVRFMKTKYFFAILGGTPRRAHLFLKHLNNSLGYLDPHTTYQALQNINQVQKHMNEFTSKLEWIKQEKIDSSMCIGFAFRKDQIEEFWLQMQQIKAELKDGFFIYMDKIKPQYDQNAIIQIDDFQFDEIKPQIKNKKQEDL